MGMRRWNALATVTAWTFALSACSGPDDPAPANSAAGATQPSPVGDTIGSVAPTPAGSVDITASTSTVPPEPTGVAGLDDDDAFCVAWVEYLGTVQAVSVASAFGELTPEALVSLELAGAPTVTAAGATIVALLPDELEAEREDIAERLIGPFVRRAQSGVDALVASGATETDLDDLRRIWREALTARVAEDPVLAVPPLDPPLGDLVVVAGRAFAANVRPFATDPSLLVADVRTPLLDSYLAAQCPAVADSGGGDSL